MSCDNGIYLFRTKDEIRVSCVKAAEELTFSFTDDLEGVELPCGYVPTRILEYFAESIPHTDLLKAVYEAECMLAGLNGRCEYGICLLPEYKGTWQNIREAAAVVAGREIDALRRLNDSACLQEIRLLRSMIDIKKTEYITY